VEQLNSGFACVILNKARDWMSSYLSEDSWQWEQWCRSISLPFVFTNIHLNS